MSGGEKSRFIGRSRELAELCAALEHAASGEPSVTLIGGEPGVGKSYLADRFGELAAARGFTDLWGRSWEGDGAPPLWPWIQIVRSRVRRARPELLPAELGEWARHLARLVPEIRDHLPELALPTPPPDGEALRFELFQAIAGFLHNASRTEPLLVVIDDLHFADRASLLLLRFLVSNLQRTRIAVLALYRGLEIRNAPVADIFAEIVPSVRHLPLGPLGATEVAQLIETSSGAEPSASFAARLHEATAGNPFFVCEAVRLLVAEGHSPQGTAPAKLPIPEGVRAVIRRRLAFLPPRTRAALSAAAVFGREFDPRLLVGAGLVDSQELADILADATTAEMLEAMDDDQPRQRFRHLLVREVLYEELRATERAELHRRLGEALEDLAQGQIGPHLTELAHHFFEAGAAADPAKAVDYADRAGQRAMGVFAYEEAARQFERAIHGLERWRGGDDTRRCQLEVARGTALMRAGDFHAARRTLIAAASLADSIGAAAELARAAVILEGPYQAFEMGIRNDQLIRILETARARLPEDELRLRALTGVALARALFFTERRDEIVPLGREAIETARCLSDASTLVEVLVKYTGATWGPNDLEERMALNAEAVRIAIANGLKRSEVVARNGLSIWHLQAGNLAGAEAEVEPLRTLAPVLREPYLQMLAAIVDAGRALLRGEFEAVEPLAMQVLAFGREAESNDGVSLAGTILFLLRREQGRLDEMVHSTEAMVREFPQSPGFRCLLSWSLVETGQADPARRELEQVAARGLETLPRDMFWLGCMAVMAEVAVALEDERRAAEIYDLLVPFASYWNVITQMITVGSVALSLGRLATLLHRFDDAERHFEAALAAHASTPPWLAHTQRAYARMLVQRGLAGDRRRAAALMELGLTTARRLGMGSILGAEQDARSRPIAASPSHAPADERVAGPTRAMLRPEGTLWRISFGDHHFSLVSAKGLEYLARLLANPDQELHVLEIVGGAKGTAKRATQSTNQTRVNVQRRLSDALAKIHRHDKQLGAYLARTIHTGTFCVYRPDPKKPIVWELYGAFIPSQ